MYRKLVLVPAVGLVLTAMWATPAWAADCTFNPTTHRVTVTIEDETATMSVGPAGEILVDGVACDMATTQDADLVVVSGQTGSDEVLEIDLTGGPFAPGSTAESDIPEIEFRVSLGNDEGDALAVQGSSDAEVFKVAASSIGLNADGDEDVGTVGVPAFRIHAGAGPDEIRAIRSGKRGRLLDLRGGSGNDDVEGRQRADVLFGGDGDDVLDGGADDDRLSGGPGDDVLGGRAGDDILQGDDGTDRAALTGAPNPLKVNLAKGSAKGWGDDTLAGVEDVSGSRHNDRLVGDERGNVLAGKGGNDVLEGRGRADRLLGAGAKDFIVPGPGKDFVHGGGGPSDLVTLRSSRDAVRINLSAGTTSGQGPDELVSIERAVGSHHNDEIIGSEVANTRLVGARGNDEIRGIGGEDRLRGGPGNDDLFGGDGDDHLAGSRGNDTLEGEGGDDTLVGGPGNDTCIQGPGSGVRARCEN